RCGTAGKGAFSPRLTFDKDASIMPCVAYHTKPDEASRMKLLRTITWFTRLLVGLFLAPPFAGLVAAPCPSALPVWTAGAIQADMHHMGAPQGHHQHAQGHSDNGSMPPGHHDHGPGPGDACCALHGCFAGLLPPVLAISTKAIAGEPLSAAPNDVAP